MYFHPFFGPRPVGFSGGGAFSGDSAASTVVVTLGLRAGAAEWLFVVVTKADAGHVVATRMVAAAAMALERVSCVGIAHTLMMCSLPDVSVEVKSARDFARDERPPPQNKIERKLERRKKGHFFLIPPLLFWSVFPFSLFFSTSPRPVVVVLASGSSAKGGREYQEGTNQGPAPLGALGSLLARFDNVS